MRCLAIFFITTIFLTSYATIQKPKTLDQVRADLDCIEYKEGNAYLTPVKNPERFNEHEYINFYIDLMEKYNKGDTDNHHDPTDLVLSVIGHTHSPRLVKKPKNERMYYLMDCGSWANGGHEFGVILGREMAVCQWGDETKQTIKPKKSYKKAPTARIMRKK